MLKPFLTAYQTDLPTIPFLYGDLFKHLKNVVSTIIKPNLMDKCKTALKLKEIDLYSSTNHLIAKEIDIVFKLKKRYGPFFLWMGFTCLKARATLRRQFTFYD